MSGFTLTEFLVTLAIAAIFLTVAVPGYWSLLQNNRVIRVVNNLSASLNFARMESVKRGVKVSVCAAADASLTTCGGATQWSQGWLVFLDADNNNLVDSTNNLVKISEALPAGTQVTASSNIISYDGSGFLTSGTFTLNITAPGCTGYNARALTVTPSGRLTIASVVCN